MTWSGSEQVAGRIAELFDATDVYAFAGLPHLLDRAFPGRRVHTSRLGRSAFVRRRWQWLLPAMAWWWRRVDLRRHDIVLTCSHSTVNSIRVRPDALHVSYCCTPMRYAWLWRTEEGRIPAPLRPLWPLIAALLRRSDRRRSRHVDAFVAVSSCVADRIRSSYGRDSTVVYPPVNTDFFTVDLDVPREDFFLVAGRLVAYKRVDVAIDAARRAGVALVVAGSGPELVRLRRSAGRSVRFVEAPSDAELRVLYRRARALVFPGVEDFGMVPVEAQACGTPVIAFAQGGALETVRDGETGVLYRDPSAEALAAALRTFDPAPFDVATLRRNAERFSIHRFDGSMRSVVDKVCRERAPARI
jgi:glycosyltransferase involved in cell wall biosynthesis